MRALNPSAIRPPLARYSHGIAVPARSRLTFVAGQLGIDKDDIVHGSSEIQAHQCFMNISHILHEDGMDLNDVVRLTVYVTGRDHMEGYRSARDRLFTGTPPATTLIVVAALVRPECVIEIEAIAAASDGPR